MSQNIYDDPGFFAGYATLDRSVKGLDGAPEWPAIQRLLPALAGLRVVDLGCGYGWFCRWAQQQGAKQIIGFDLSNRMLERAREMTTGKTIEYRCADLQTLTLPADSCDLVYSSLALHYLPDIAPLFATIYQALVPGGTLVFSAEHPIYTAPLQQGWQVDEQGKNAGRSATISRKANVSATGLPRGWLNSIANCQAGLTRSSPPVLCLSSLMNGARAPNKSRPNRRWRKKKSVR